MSGSYGRGRHVVVVGGGITGLTAALALRRADDRLHVTVLEASPAVGGKLALHEVAGLTMDSGAEALLARRPEAVDLAREVGLGDLLVEPATTAASVWSRGALHPLPAGQVLGVPSDLRALAASGILTRRELARVAADGALPRTRIDGDVSVGSFVTRRLGRAIVDRLVEPLLGGVSAGRADRLSFAATMPALHAAARVERSLLAAAAQVRSPAADSVPAFAGLRGGVGQLPAAVARASGARIRTGTMARALRRTPTGWDITVGPTRSPEILAADAVVLAVPARPMARLLAGCLPAAAADIDHVDYASIALITYVLPTAATGALPAGAGFLVPPVERRFVKGVTLASAKWGWLGAQAARAGVDVVRVSVGRHGDEPELQRSDTELAERGLFDLAEIAGIVGPPLDVVVTRWGGALPQYAVGHLARVARVRGALAAQPTLAVAGAALDGIGVPACIASGRAAAAGVLAALDAPSARDAGEDGSHE